MLRRSGAKLGRSTDITLRRSLRRHRRPAGKCRCASQACQRPNPPTSRCDILTCCIWSARAAPQVSKEGRCAGSRGKNAPKGVMDHPLRSGRTSDMFSPGASGTKAERSSFDVDRLAPVRFRIGEPGGRILRRRIHRPRRFRLGHGRHLLGPAGGLCARIGQRGRGWLNLHLNLHPSAGITSAQYNNDLWVLSKGVIKMLFYTHLIEVILKFYLIQHQYIDQCTQLRVIFYRSGSVAPRRDRRYDRLHVGDWLDCLITGCVAQSPQGVLPCYIKVIFAPKPAACASHRTLYIVVLN